MSVTYLIISIYQHRYTVVLDSWSRACISCNFGSASIKLFHRTLLNGQVTIYYLELFHEQK
jgi:hypothetical protein